MTRKSQLRIFKGGVEIPLPPGSSRWLDFSMDPIAEASQIERAIDGSIVDLGSNAFNLYAVVISCSDMRFPAFSNVWPRDVLTIHAPQSLVEYGDAITLSRDPVPESVVAYDAENRAVAVTVNGRSVSAPGAVYVEYRPILSVMVSGFSRSSREMKASSSWSLSATEVGAGFVSGDPTEPGTGGGGTGGGSVGAGGLLKAIYFVWRDSSIYASNAGVADAAAYLGASRIVKIVGEECLSLSGGVLTPAAGVSLIEMNVDEAWSNLGTGYVTISVMGDGVFKGNSSRYQANYDGLHFHLPVIVTEGGTYRFGISANPAKTLPAYANVPVATIKVY